MSAVSDAMRQHHAQLLSGLSEQVERLVERRPDADPAALAALLTDELLPHAAGEERHLYPVIDPLVKAHGSATATMTVDHEFITEYVHQISDLAKAAAAASPAERPALYERLARYGLQLEAIFRLHLRKEEEVYMPLFDRYVSVADQQRVLDGMHETEPEAPQTPAPAATTLDVRTIAPAQRHDLIFQTYAALPAGGSFTLVNDHDPKPLYYQFKFEREGEFTWEYEAQGPEVWQVRIGKTGGAAAACHHGHAGHPAHVEIH